MAAKRAAAKKKQSGRPKTGTKMVGVWLQPSTHEKLRARANHEQRKMSTVAERLLLEGIERLNAEEAKGDSVTK